MTLKYESELLFDLMKRDGDDTPSDVLPYESELKEKYLQQVVGAYPKLQDYRPEWLNYNLYHQLPSDFPVESVANVTSASFQNVVPYVYKSAILKGQTLVNLLTNPRVLINANDEVTLTDNKISLIKSSSGNSYVLFDFLSKPSTEYTVFMNFKKFSQQADYYGVYLDGVYGDIGSIPFNAGSLGVIKRKFTSLDKHDGILSIGIHSDTPIGTEIEFNDIMVLEGDYTNVDIPYFEGMQSVKLPVLTTSNEDGTKTNILTVNEDVTLRSNGDICDELNLLTGQLTQRIGEDGVVLSQEVVKTVDLSCVNEQGDNETFRPIEGTMHVITSSQTLPPLLDMSVPVEATSQNLMSFVNIVEGEK